MLISPKLNTIDDLLAFPSTTTKKRLQSLLGNINTLNKWVSFLSNGIQKMRELLKANTHFGRAPEHEKELEAIRVAAQQVVPLQPFVPHRTTYLYTDAIQENLGAVRVSQRW